MIKANELKEIRERAIAEEIETRQERAEAFCEDLSKTLEERAKEKYNFYNTEVPKSIDAYVYSILKDNGYDVRFLNATTLAIYW